MPWGNKQRLRGQPASRSVIPLQPPPRRQSQHPTRRLGQFAARFACPPAGCFWHRCPVPCSRLSLAGRSPASSFSAATWHHAPRHMDMYIGPAPLTATIAAHCYSVSCPPEPVPPHAPRRMRWKPCGIIGDHELLAQGGAGRRSFGPCMPSICRRPTSPDTFDYFTYHQYLLER